MRDVGTVPATGFLRHETTHRAGYPAWRVAVDDGDQPFTIVTPSLHRPADRIFHNRRGLRIRLRIFSGNALSQAHGEARIRCSQIIHYSTRRTDILRTLADPRVRLHDWRLSYNLFPWPKDLVRPVSEKSSRSNCRIDATRLSASVNGYPSNVRPLFLRYSLGILGRSKMGMEKGDWDKLFYLVDIG